MGRPKITDPDILGTIVDEVIDAYPGQAARAKYATSLRGFFIDEVMTRTHGKADGPLTAKLVKEKIHEFSRRDCECRDGGGAGA